MTSAKFCVFCGKPPEVKNKEHILPQWLLALTGDPNRVVTFGINYATGKTISFAWKSLVVPACTSCNSSFATLEGKVRPIIEALIAREPIPATHYDTLLDWLDKVRVGLWLNYHLIQGNPTDIIPAFHIDTRIRTKDRLVAVYPLDNNNFGLNAYGVETLAFHRAPSVFGLRINNILLVNCSSDYILSGRCGFPFPTRMELLLDGDNAGMLRVTDFQTRRKIKSPLLRFTLYKPSVYLLQPIMQKTLTETRRFPSGFIGNFSVFDSFLAENTVGTYLSGVGKLYRQNLHSVSRIDNMEELIEFDSVTGSECKRLGYLISQIYELQIYLHGLYIPVVESKDTLLNWGKLKKLMYQYNKMAIREFKKSASSK